MRVGFQVSFLSNTSDGLPRREATTTPRPWTEPCFSNVAIPPEKIRTLPTPMKNLFFFARVINILAALAATALFVGVALAEGHGGVWNVALRKKATTTESGVASYYGVPYHGRQTASGEIFNMNDLTAAHPTLKFGTKVKVTHLSSSRSVTVRINDRGPFVKGRVIDLSQAAAAELQMIRTGLADVKIEVLE